MSPTILWLIAAAAFLTLEAFGLPGVGALFAGLGALTVAAMLSAGLLSDSDILWQVGTFLLNSSLLALILWKPLKKWRTTRSEAPYSNMVGDEATVIGALEGDTLGQVRWSGTTMNARLAHGHGSLAEGSAVIIREVRGTTLIVAAK